MPKKVVQGIEPMLPRSDEHQTASGISQHWKWITLGKVAGFVEGETDLDLLGYGCCGMVFAVGRHKHDGLGHMDREAGCY